MDINVDLKNKQLLLNSLREVLKQGERLADTPVFLLPTSRDGVDLTALSWTITAATDKDTLAAAYSLDSSVDGEHLRITWPITESFTSVATDNMMLMLAGADEGGSIVIKFHGDAPIFVAADLYGTYAPTPDAISDALIEMQEILAQARVIESEIESVEYNPVRVDPDTQTYWNYINGEWVDSGVIVNGAGDMLEADYDATSEVKDAGGIPTYITNNFVKHNTPTQWVPLKSGMTWGAGETQVIPDSSKYAMLAFETTTGRMTGVRVTQGGPMTIFNVNIASTGTYLQIGSGLASTNGDSITLTQLAYQRLTPGSAIPTPVNVTVSAVYGLATT